MRLGLFNFIDGALMYLDENRELFEKVAHELSKAFRAMCKSDESFVNITYRVKSRESVKEKIVRNNYYVSGLSEEDTIFTLQDLVGLRCECRFIEDEEKIFKKIKKIFNIKVDDDYYTTKSYKKIRLKLSDHQPQIQKNGFEIYKIDGEYVENERKIHFELQIKSIVNVFWGEIDHKVLYKNYNYMITENFFRDILGSIRTNLIMIDTQLRLLYNHVESMENKSYQDNTDQLKILLSKIIHDVFINKVREELGIILNFKDTTDVIVDYLFMKCVKQKELSYGDQFIKLLNRITAISDMELDLEHYLVFDRTPSYFDEFTRSIGASLVNVINEDFEWNLFFKIIFIIEGGSRAESFEEFLYFLRYKYSLIFLDGFADTKLTYKAQKEIEDELLKITALGFKKESTFDFIMRKAPKKIEQKIPEIIQFIDKNSKDDLKFIFDKD